MLAVPLRIKEEIRPERGLDQLVAGAVTEKFAWMSCIFVRIDSANERTVPLCSQQPSSKIRLLQSTFFQLDTMQYAEQYQDDLAR